MKNLSRLLKVTLQRITRNPYNALAAVLVMFLAFFTSGAFILTAIGSSRVLAYVESLPQVRAFLKDDATSAQVQKIQKSLLDSGVVSDVKYISKEQALKIYKDRFKDDPLLTFAVTADILPASIEVSTHELGDLDKVAALLNKEPIVDEVVFQRAIADTLRTWVGTVQNVGGGAMIFLLLTSFLITLIVIGLNISIHKDEIEIMKLVGATSAYVRTPFILEGIFYGMASAVVATFSLLAVYLWLSPAINKAFTGISVFPSTTWLFVYLLLGEILVGVAIGVVGAIFATRRYLNV